jgi:hypothetical protein
LRQFFFYNLFTAFFAAAAVLVLATVIVAVFYCIGVKFVYGEAHFAEYGAGVIVGAGLAVFFGQTEAGGRKHKLYATFHTDYREHADGYEYVVYPNLIYKIAVEIGTDFFGDGFDAHTAVAKLFATLYNLAV